MNLTPPEITDKLESIPPDYLSFHQARISVNLKKVGSKHSEKVEHDLEHFISMMPHNLPELTTATLLYDILRTSIHYDHTENQLRYTYVGAFYKQNAVCMGIAELYMELCRRMGLRCELIIGYAGSTNSYDEDGLHAWNQLYLSTGKDKTPECFHCDPTWDLAPSPEQPRRYFLKSDDFMKEHQHIWLAERYAVCPRSLRRQPRLPKKGVEVGCLILRRAASSK